MKRAVIACLTALALCAGCALEDIGFEDCDCDDAYFSSVPSH